MTDKMFCRVHTDEKPVEAKEKDGTIHHICPKCWDDRIDWMFTTMQHELNNNRSFPINAELLEIRPFLQYNLLAGISLVFQNRHILFTIGNGDGGEELKIDVVRAQNTK